MCLLPYHLIRLNVNSLSCGAYCTRFVCGVMVTGLTVVKAHPNNYKSSSWFFYENAYLFTSCNKMSTTKAVQWLVFWISLLQLISNKQQDGCLASVWFRWDMW